MATQHYDVLGVPRREALRGIDSAYRDLEKHFHPERAGRAGTRRYRQTTEAHDTLADRRARAAYDRRRGVAPAPAAPKLSLRRDFHGADPPLQQLLETIRRDFTGELRKSGRVDLLLLWLYAPERPAALDLAVPVYHPCPSCHGSGSILAVACKRCDGSGALEDEENVRIEPGKAAVEGPIGVSLEEVGIHSVALAVGIIVGPAQVIR